MLPSIFQILIAISLLCFSETIPVTDLKCSFSRLGCLCQNLENITEIEVEPCCSKKSENLIITGALVKNISVDIVKLSCASNFINLVIRETAIVKFYYPFKGLRNLISVNIEKNQNLSDLHRLIFEDINPEIKTIYVELNSIRTISRRTFSNLTKLNTLRLSDNKIGYIEDQSFSGLQTLHSLHINNNILTLLNSEMFFGLENLKVLSLLNNPLQEPISKDIFKHLKSLRYLMMSHGTNSELPGINQLPPGIFFNVKQLRTLNMTSIRIRNLTSVTFYGLSELENLDLQGNRLSIVPSGTLQQVPKIWSINLSKNQLLCLLADTFHSLPRLSNLDLSQNELSYISEDVFKDLLKLQTLDLAENNIYVIERNAFATLHSLMIIKINVVHGRPKNDIQTKFRTSPLAKLRNTTKIVGLAEYFGVSMGLGQPAAVYEPYSNSSRREQCPSASLSDINWVDVSTTGSRKYLLIIVGICVVFLLVAFAIIMTYRAWSKHRMGDVALAVDADEKQEMLMSNKNFSTVNGGDGRGERPQGNHSRKSINGGSVTEAAPHAADSNNQRHSNSQLATKPPISDERCHSDDESALTPLGVL